MVLATQNINITVKKMYQDAFQEKVMVKSGKLEICLKKYGGMLKNGEYRKETEIQDTETIDGEKKGKWKDAQWYESNAILAAANGRDPNDFNRNPIEEGFLIVGEARSTCPDKERMYSDISTEFIYFFKLAEEFEISICFVCKKFSNNERIAVGGQNSSDSAHWIFSFFIDKENVLVVDPFGTGDQSKVREITDICNNRIDSKGKALPKRHFWFSTTKIQTDGRSCGQFQLNSRVFSEKFSEKSIQLNPKNYLRNYVSKKNHLTTSLCIVLILLKSLEVMQ